MSPSGYSAYCAPAWPRLWFRSSPTTVYIHLIYSLGGCSQLPPLHEYQYSYKYSSLLKYTAKDMEIHNLLFTSATVNFLDHMWPSRHGSYILAIKLRLNDQRKPLKYNRGQIVESDQVGDYKLDVLRPVWCSAVRE